VISWSRRGSAQLVTPGGLAVAARVDGAWLVLAPDEAVIPLFLWVRWRNHRPPAGSALGRAYGWLPSGLGFLQVGGGGALQAWLARHPASNAIGAAFGHDQVRLADGQLRAPIDAAHVGDLLPLLDHLQPDPATQRDHLREMVRLQSQESVAREVERQLQQRPGDQRAIVETLLAGSWPQHRLEGIQRCLAIGGELTLPAAWAAAEVLAQPGPEKARVRAARLLLQAGQVDGSIVRELTRGLRIASGSMQLAIVDAALGLDPDVFAGPVAQALSDLLQERDRKRRREALRRVDRLPPGGPRDELVAWAIGATSGDTHRELLNVAARAPSERLGKALVARAMHATGESRAELLRIALNMHPGGVERMALKMLEDRDDIGEALGLLHRVGGPRAVAPVGKFAGAWFGPADRKALAREVLAEIRGRMGDHGGGLSVVGDGGELSVLGADAGGLSPADRDRS